MNAPIGPPGGEGPHNLYRLLQLIEAQVEFYRKLTWWNGIMFGTFITLQLITIGIKMWLGLS